MHEPQRLLDRYVADACWLQPTALPGVIGQRARTA